MRRRLPIVLLLLAGLLVLPTVSAGGTPPVTGAREVVLDLTPAGDVWEGTLAVDDAVSVTAAVGGREVSARWRTPDGWSSWRALAVSREHAPDDGTPESTRARADVAEPLWTGRTDRIQLRATAPGPLAVEVVEIDGDLDYRPGASVPPATADAAAVWPPIVPRQVWDPNGDCTPDGSPRYTDGADRVFIHHTAVFPRYRPEEADDIVRAICVQHVNKRGFDDIAYNFLVDQYGVIYQGRAGGILRAVEGAHAQGFNERSVGISVIGNFEEQAVPKAAVDSIDALTAWLADLHDIDPGEVTPHVSTGGSHTRFPEGAEVALRGVVGHRDTGKNTLCPGEHLYQLVGYGRMAQRVNTRLRVDYGWPAPTPAPAPPTPAPPAPTAAPNTPGTPAEPAPPAPSGDDGPAPLPQPVTPPDPPAVPAAPAAAAAAATTGGPDGAPGPVSAAPGTVGRLVDQLRTRPAVRGLLRASVDATLGVAATD